MSNSKHIGNYSVTRLNGNNLTDVEQLFAAVYGKDIEIGFFQKKYNTAFTGAEYIGFIAYDDSAPIAFYAVIPCFLEIDGKIILSAQSADTMTHPQYRNKGLFVELALHTYQLCKDSGIQLIYGFPNQNSLPGFVNKLGWERTGTLECFIIPAGKLSWGRFFKKLALAEKLYGCYQQKILNKYLVSQSGIDNSVAVDGFDGVYRGESYFNYKTYTDTQIIKIGNSTLWIKTGSIFLIGDILLTPDEFDSMMQHLKKLAVKLGIKEIHFHTSTGTNLYNQFAARFKTITSFPVIFKQIMGNTPIENIKFTSADIDTF